MHPGAVLGATDPVEVLCRELRAEQLGPIQRRAGSSEDVYRVRMATYAARGLSAMRRVMATSGIDQERLEACLTYADLDPRFAFLQDVPIAAILATARGTSLEATIFRAPTDEQTELALLVSLFTNLLDGLLDEAPALLEQERQKLADTLLGQNWARTGIPPEFSPDPDRHPLVALLLDIMVEIIRRVLRSVGWLADGALQQRFGEASRQAYIAEADSVHCVVREENLNAPAKCRNAIEAKSIGWAWVVSLTPMLVRGWPAGIEPAAYARFSRSVGLYGGWIDDVADLGRDIQQRCWSSVLVVAFQCLGQPLLRSTREWQFVMSRALAVDSIAKHIVDTGCSLFDDLLRQLDGLRVETRTLVPVVADLTQAWLSGAGTSEIQASTLL